MKPPIKTMKEAFSNTTAVQGTTWDPTAGRSPYNVMTGLGSLEQLMTGKISEEERNQKAPKILTFTLDRAIEQMATAYQDLMTLSVTLSSSLKDGMLTKAEKHILRQKVKEIKQFMENMKVMSYEIERMHL